MTRAPLCLVSPCNRINASSFKDAAATEIAFSSCGDPSEVKARPRFGDQFARAARERRARSEPGRTVLGWNFEIPRPEPDDLPLASLSPTEATQTAGSAPEVESLRGGAADADTEAGGPFAGA